MKDPAFKRYGRPASDLLEESVRLLRRAPATALLAYYIGSVPCMLGALYFVADMRQDAYAAERLLESAAGMAFLYFWMKCWQVVFTSRLTAELLLEDPPRWTFGRVLRMASVQIAVQSSGLVLRPAALLLVFPTVFTTNFYLNATTLGDGEQRGLWDLIRRSFAMCRLRAFQAHVSATLLSIFGLFVWLNIFVSMLFAPLALKMFFGVETAFSQHIWGLLNQTFFAASFAATYLCIDPIRKSLSVLRCFHGGSLTTGADIDVQFKRVRGARPLAVAAALFILFSTFMAPAPALAAMKSQPKVNSEDLNRSLDDVIERREFAWRAPRDRKGNLGEEDVVEKSEKNIGRWLEHASWKLRQWMEPKIEKIEKWFDGDNKSSSGKRDWLTMVGSVRFLFTVLLVLAAILLLVLVVRARMHLPVSEAEAEAAAPSPDLSLENVTADQLPEDGWLNLAGELMQRGELRLALRASYLASLAHLGQREFIRLARHKSNHDYDRELQRRARGQSDLLTAFEGNLDAFERAWYGEHPVTTETLSHFSENLQTIREC